VAGTTTKIEMKAGCTGGSGVAAMAVVMANRAAHMADRAIPKNRATMAVMSDDDAFAIHRRAARATVVREAAAAAGAVVVSVKRLRIDRSESSKAGAYCEESDECFHDEWRFAFDLLPHSRGVFMRRGPPAPIRDSFIFFHRLRESPALTPPPTVSAGRIYALWQSESTPDGRSL